jgi:hypothetical protein
VLKQNKDDAKENDGGKANYDLLAITIKQGPVSVAGTSLCGSRILRKQKAREAQDQRFHGDLPLRGRLPVVGQFDCGCAIDWQKGEVRRIFAG